MHLRKKTPGKRKPAPTASEAELAVYRLLRGRREEDTVIEPEQLGDRIARLRRSLGWNQSELAYRAGCKTTQISKYERGTYEPRLSVLSRLAAAFGTSTDYLLTGKEAAPGEPDRLIALWPALERLPLALRNQIAGFLHTVLRAQSLLGLSEVAWQRPPRTSPASEPARRGRRSRAQRSR